MRSNQLVQASADVILLNSALARYGPEIQGGACYAPALGRPTRWSDFGLPRVPGA
jgi:hypothetical protein